MSTKDVQLRPESGWQEDEREGAEDLIRMRNLEKRRLYILGYELLERWDFNLEGNACDAISRGAAGRE